MFNRLKSTLIACNAIKRNFSTSNSRLSAHAEYRYRLPPAPAPRFNQIAAEVVTAFMWWWIFWHLLTEPEHIYGEHDIPNPAKWTDEELGIPPDDED